MPQSSLISVSAQDYVNQILNYAETSATLQEFNSHVDAIKNSAIANLTGENLDIVIGATEIATSSAYLWAPEDQGGYALLDKTLGYSASEEIISTDGPVTYASKPMARWKKALIGDVGASSQYFMAIGIGGSI